jgi:hypothetical protein
MDRLKWVAWFFALAAVALLSATASAQAVKYDVLPVDPAIDADLVKYQRAASGYASARDVSGLPASQVAAIQRYYQVYVPAKITQPDATHMINDVMGHAMSAMQRAVRSQTPGAINVMRWLYIGLKPVAMGNYQPAARVSAIHFIAQLAQPPAVRGGAPRPYPFVLKDLKALYLDESNSDGVRMAALKGLDRFVKLTPSNQIDAATKQELTTEMTQLLQSAPPAGRDPLAHAFVQRYSVNILTNLSTDASLAKELVSISTNADNPNLIALYSAAAIAKLPGKMAEGDVKTNEVLMQWSKRVLAAYEKELKRLEALDKKKLASPQPAPPESFVGKTPDPSETTTARPSYGGGMEGMEDEMYGMEGTGYEMDMDMDEMDMGMDGMMMGNMMGMGTTEKPQPPEIVASRKSLNYALQQVLLGVTGNGEIAEDVETMEVKGGLMAATPADSLAGVKEWLQSVSDVTTQLNDGTIATRVAYVKALQEQVTILTALSEGRAVTEKLVDEFDPLSRDFGALPAAQPADGTPADAPAEADAGLDALLN